MASLLQATANVAGQALSVMSGVSNLAGSAANAVTAYQGLQSTVSTLSGGLINLPNVDTGLSQALGLNATSNTILTGVWGQHDESNAHVVGSSKTAEKGAFKWTEGVTTPDDFATADSTLIYLGEPLWLNNPVGDFFTPIGLCQGFNFTTGTTVTPVKELRCEETIVIPGKSQAGNMNISRLCGAYQSLADRLHGGDNWNFSSHSERFRQLFGLLVIFYRPSRRNAITSLYFERCAISSVGMSVQAGNYQIVENMNIVFGRCINTKDNTTYKNTVADTTAIGKLNNAINTTQTVLGALQALTS